MRPDITLTDIPDVRTRVRCPWHGLQGWGWDRLQVRFMLHAGRCGEQTHFQHITAVSVTSAAQTQAWRLCSTAARRTGSGHQQVRFPHTCTFDVLWAGEWACIDDVDCSCRCQCGHWTRILLTSGVRGLPLHCTNRKHTFWAGPAICRFALSCQLDMSIA